MPTLRVAGLGQLEAQEGETLLEALRRQGVVVQAGCGGLGLCGMCRVRVLEGLLSPPTRRELELLPAHLLEGGWRLACQARVLGDVELEVPQPKRALAKARVRRALAVTPPALFVPLSVGEGEPSYEEEALSKLRGLGVRVSRASRSALNALAERGSGVAVVVDGEVVDVAETFAGFGMAVDVGTTSVAASLVDLTSGAVVAEAVDLNLQLQYGADIISRIGYAIKEPEGLAKLQRAAVETVNALIARLGAPPGRIYRVVVAGNSVMLHLLFGVSPRTLGFLPFRPVYRRGLRARGRELGLAVHPDAIVESLPILGGYVGGDVVGDILASGLLEYERAMLIDVGTNGEIVLKWGDACVAASAPAGPAFEGVGLRSGMMAVAGAIERVKLGGDGSVEFSVIGGSEPRGICGSGYIDLLAELVRAGILSRDGRLLDGPRVRDLGGVRAFVLDEERGVALTQQDVRKLQLAVAAVKFAAKHLLRALGAEPSRLERVIVAGDFGYHIDALNAMEIGPLPPVEPQLVEYIGNGSLTGAEMFMLSEEARRAAEELPTRCRVLDVPREERAFVAELRLSW